MRKCISISDHDLELLEHCKKENGLTSDSATISFLLNKHLTEKEELAVVIRQELEKNYLPAQRIRWGVQTAEQNTILLLDAINSLLWLFNAKECFRTEQFMHPVIQESQDALKEKIAYFKQQSDDRKSKQGTQKS